MIVAIASDGENLDSIVSSIGARSPYFLIFNDRELVKKIKNPFLYGGGAGFSVARMLQKEGVNLLITGKVGGNMASALNQNGIELRIINGKKIEEIINSI